MKLTIESTKQMAHINGVEARVWVGHTDTGIAVHCFIPRVEVDQRADAVQFVRELQEHRPPDPELLVATYPLRMIL